MAWTAPRTWVVGEIVTAAMMNAHVRDNLNALNAGAAMPNLSVAGTLTVSNQATFNGFVQVAGSGAVAAGWDVSGTLNAFSQFINPNFQASSIGVGFFGKTPVAKYSGSDPTACLRYYGLMP